MNAKDLKELNEKRGAKAKELVTLLNKETLTKEERDSLPNRRQEVADLDERLTRAAEAIALAVAKPTELSETENRDIGTFDYAKVLNHMVRVSRGQASTLDGVEAEMFEEGDKERREAQVSGGGALTLPRLMVRRQDRSERRAGRDFRRDRRSMTATGTTSTTGDQGGMTVATTPMGLLDDFYNGLAMEAAGITILEGLRGNLNLPRYLKPSNPAHKAENASADGLSPTTAMLSLSPHRLPAYIDISEQLLMQSSAAIETVIRNNLNSQLSALVQDMWINGAGSNSQPTGILGTTGIGVVYSGGATSNGTNANGATQVYRDWTRLRTAVAKQNALRGRLGYLTNSQTVGQAFETKRGLITPADTNPTDSRMIIDDAETMRVAGFPVFETNSVPATLAKGTSGSTLSANIFGAWQDFYGAFWSGINLELLRDATIGIQGLYRLAAAVYYDGGIVRPKSFAAIVDVVAP
jgi:HK97 family phage major capsid protein